MENVPGLRLQEAGCKDAFSPRKSMSWLSLAIVFPADLFPPVFASNLPPRPVVSLRTSDAGLRLLDAVNDLAWKGHPSVPLSSLGDPLKMMLVSQRLGPILQRYTSIFLWGAEEGLWGV